jgi:hypothetical protein
LLLRKFAFSLLVLLLITKVVAVIMRGPSPLVLDAAAYWDLGGLVSQGDWWLMAKPIAYRTPGYPWLIGSVRWIFDSPLFVLVCLQGVLWIATIILTAMMAVDLSGDRRSAWIVLGVATVMISSVTYIAAVLTETLFVFAFLLHLWMVVRFARRPSLAGGLLVGATLGLAILTRPVAMLIWIADAVYLIASWYWIPDHRSPDRCRRRELICVAFAALVTIGCVSPWLARNHAMFGKAMLTEFVGRNLWIVTFQDGSGAGLPMPDSESAGKIKTQLGDSVWPSMESDQSWRDTWTMSKALNASGMDDPAGDRLMKTVAKDAIFDSPTTFGKKTARRLVNFWRTRATELPIQVADLVPDAELSKKLFAGQPVWGVKVAPVDTAIRHRWSNWLPGNTFLMFATAAATMLMIWRRPTRAAGLWIAAMLVYFSTVTAVLEIPAYRYRMIIEPLVLLAVAVAITPLLFPPDEPTEATCIQ